MTAGINITDGKLLCVGAAAILILSFAWVGAGQEDLRRLRHRSVAIALTGSAYQPEKWPQPDATVRLWPGPATQASGPGWIYEVFAPPSIYTDALTTDFTVVPPARPGAATGLRHGELLTVKPEPYRVQLMGYVGGPGNYRAVLVRPGQPGTLLIREGQRLADLGLTLLRLTVNNVPSLPDDATPIHGRTAQATVHDTRSGENVVLDSRTRRHTGALLAVLRSTNDLRPRERREGDDWTVGTATYRVEKIQLDPAMVIITRLGLDPSAPERTVLYPAAGDHHPGNKIAIADAISSGATATGLASDRH